jgi:hypothetical protein
MPSWKKIIVSGSNAKLHHVSASGNLVPIAKDGSSLGSAGLQFSDLFLAEGAVINFDGGDFTLTQTGNLLELEGGSTRVTKLEIDSANDHIDVDTDMVLTAAADITLTPGGSNVKPGSDSAIDLGVSGTAFRKLFVDDIDLNAQGSVIGAVSLKGTNVYTTGIISSSDNFFVGNKTTQALGGAWISASNGNIELTGDVSGSLTSTGSFGRIEVAANTIAIGGTELKKTVADNIKDQDQSVTSTSSPVFAGLRVTGDVHAERYIVSSSVSIITQSFSSGSTIFGDSITDTHKFTGSMMISGNITPSNDDKFDLGSSGAEWNDLYIDGTAHIDSAQIGQLGAALDANNQAITNVDINSGNIDGATIATSDITVGADKTLDVQNGTLTLANNQISGDKVEGGTINATTITTLTSTTANVGAINATGLISSSDNFFVGNKTTQALGGAWVSASNGNIELTGDVSGSATSTGSFGRLELAAGFASLTAEGNISGGLLSTGSFGRLQTEQGNALFGSSVLTLGDHLTTQNNAVTINAAGGDRTLTLNESLTVGDGHDGTITFSAGSKTLTVENTSVVNQDLSSDADVNFGSVTTTGAVTVGGDLVINGTTTTLATSNLAIEDAFGFFATGSAGANVDGGIIVQSGSFVDSGSAMYHDKTSQRWSVAKGVGADETAITETQWSGFVATVTTASATPTGATKANYGVGEIYIDSNGDVFIYS